MTPEELSEIRKACEAATKGPWAANHQDYGDEIWFGGEGRGMWKINAPRENDDPWEDLAVYLASCDCSNPSCDSPVRNANRADAYFIANARTWIPQLLDYIEEMENLLAAHHGPHGLTGCSYCEQAEHPIYILE